MTYIFVSQLLKIILMYKFIFYQTVPILFICVCCTMHIFFSINEVHYGQCISSNRFFCKLPKTINVKLACLLSYILLSSLFLDKFVQWKISKELMGLSVTAFYSFLQICCYTNYTQLYFSRS